MSWANASNRFCVKHVPAVGGGGQRDDAYGPMQTNGRRKKGNNLRNNLKEQDGDRKKQNSQRRKSTAIENNEKRQNAFFESDWLIASNRPFVNAKRAEPASGSSLAISQTTMGMETGRH